MAARLEATKAENEVNKMTEWCKELDGKMERSAEELRKVKSERLEIDKDYKKLKTKNVELEESLAKKGAAHERMTKDMAKLEREVRMLVDMGYCSITLVSIVFNIELCA